MSWFTKSKQITLVKPSSVKRFPSHSCPHVLVTGSPVLFCHPVLVAGSPD